MQSDNLRVSVRALMAVLLALVLGCQSEPVLVEKVVDVAVTATPAPPTTPGKQEGMTHIELDFACGPYLSTPALPSQRHFILWSPDDSQLLFDYNEAIWALDVEDPKLRKVVDANPGLEFNHLRSKYRFHADISPNGGQIVYSTCEYVSKFTDMLGDPSHPTYEIATINIDGSERRRVTAGKFLDHYPVWAPSGDRIAQVSSGNERYERSSAHILVRHMDGSKRPRTVTRGLGIALFPPAWSPDGNRIAFIVYEDNSEEGRDGIEPYRLAIYTVGQDGAGLSRIGETTTLPTWSPDSSELAFASKNMNSSERWKEKILVAKPDGTELREIWTNDTDENLYDISSISWSPDGSELLVVSPSLWAIRPDGSEMRRISPWPWHSLFQPSDAVWSSDGTKIAAYGSGRSKIVTMNQDGKDFRILAAESELGLHAAEPQVPSESVDVTPCSTGLIVPDPEEHPGLVDDCETLLRAHDTLAGTATLGWNADVPISKWNGVELKRLPRRVKSLRLPSAGLTGSIPPELGNLEWLEVLDLRHNFLGGPIPTELSSLRRLQWLALEGNLLNGCTPAELAHLVSERIPLEWCQSSDSSGSTP